MIHILRLKPRATTLSLVTWPVVRTRHSLKLTYFHFDVTRLEKCVTAALPIWTCLPPVNIQNTNLRAQKMLNVNCPLSANQWSHDVIMLENLFRASCFIHYLKYRYCAPAYWFSYRTEKDTIHRHIGFPNGTLCRVTLHLKNSLLQWLKLTPVHWFTRLLCLDKACTNTQKHYIWYKEKS